LCSFAKQLSRQHPPNSDNICKHFPFLVDLFATSVYLFTKTCLFFANHSLILGGALKVFFQSGGRKNAIKVTTSGQGEILRPEIERSDHAKARQNSGFGWRGHKKTQKNNLLLKIQNSNNSGTKHNFSKKFSAHLPGQNGDLGLYFRPVSLISPKSAKQTRNIGKNGPNFPKKIF